MRRLAGRPGPLFPIFHWLGLSHMVLTEQQERLGHGSLLCSDLASEDRKKRKQEQRGVKTLSGHGRNSVNKLPIRLYSEIAMKN